MYKKVEKFFLKKHIGEKELVGSLRMLKSFFETAY